MDHPNLKSILVVDDEKDISDTVKIALEKEGYSVQTADSASSAKEILSDQAVDLMVLDVGLPDMNGFDLLRQIRKTLNVPVIFLTARSDEIDRIVGFEMGADDYVLKPFSPRELAARVRAVLKRSAGSTDESLFAVDSKKMQIRFSGKPLSLARYEYKILKLLAQRPGWIFSREKIMDMVWDTPEESYDRTVDTHIKNIRNKLKEIRPDLDPIVTHRGQGYSLKEML
ncbi:MAG: two-component system response regulator CreB [Spirochaetia bacterium]|nr:two-component system response regulator CreB [Spirochaetia bacterium]